MTEGIDVGRTTLSGLAVLAVLTGPVVALAARPPVQVPVVVKNTPTVFIGNEHIPFQASLTCNQPGDCNGLQVPADQQLVIEQLTGHCRSTGPYLVQLGVRTVAGGVEVFHGLPPLWTLNTGTTSFGVLYSFGGVTKVYADPGSTVQVNPNILTIQSGAYTCSAAISGYLTPP